MKAVEFTVAVSPDGQIAVPAEVAAQVPTGSPVQVLLLWNEGNEGIADDAAWRLAGRRQFEGAYAPEDAVYGRNGDVTGLTGQPDPSLAFRLF